MRALFAAAVFFAAGTAYCAEPVRQSSAPAAVVSTGTLASPATFAHDAPLNTGALAAQGIHLASAPLVMPTTAIVLTTASMTAATTSVALTTAAAKIDPLVFKIANYFNLPVRETQGYFSRGVGYLELVRCAIMAKEAQVSFSDIAGKRSRAATPFDQLCERYRINPFVNRKQAREILEIIRKQQ